jgi:hypothetical protein
MHSANDLRDRRQRLTRMHRPPDSANDLRDRRQRLTRMHRPPDSANDLRNRRQYPPRMRTRRMRQMIGTIAVNIQLDGLMAIANSEGDAFGPQVMGTAKIWGQMQ